MKIGLICCEQKKKLLMELLAFKKVEVDENADVFIVEKGFDPPEGKLFIGFQNETMNLLLDFISNIAAASAPEDTEIILGKVNEKYVIIHYDDILFFEAKGNNVFCITSTEKYKIREKLYELEEKLSEKNFIRVSKSFIVNIIGVKEIIPWFNRRLILKFYKCTDEVEVSKNYIKDFKNFIKL